MPLQLMCTAYKQQDTDVCFEWGHTLPLLDRKETQCVILPCIWLFGLCLDTQGEEESLTTSLQEVHFHWLP